MRSSPCLNDMNHVTPCSNCKLPERWEISGIYRCRSGTSSFASMREMAGIMPRSSSRLYSASSHSNALLLKKNLIATANITWMMSLMKTHQMYAAAIDWQSSRSTPFERSSAPSELPDTRQAASLATEDIKDSGIRSEGSHVPPGLSRVGEISWCRIHCVHSCKS